MLHGILEIFWLWFGIGFLSGVFWLWGHLKLRRRLRTLDEWKKDAKSGVDAESQWELPGFLGWPDPYEKHKW